MRASHSRQVSASFDHRRDPAMRKSNQFGPSRIPRMNPERPPSQSARASTG